jgi:hypothetical protein
MRQNKLYLAVLPLIHLTPVGPLGFGLTEQTLTLFPDKNLANHLSTTRLFRVLGTGWNKRTG